MININIALTIWWIPIGYYSILQISMFTIWLILYYKCIPNVL